MESKIKLMIKDIKSNLHLLAFAKILAHVAAISMSVCLPCAAVFGGGNVRVTKIDTPERPGGGGSIRAFINENVELKATFYNTSGSDESFSGDGWRWWTDHAARGNYTQPNDKIDLGSFSSGTPGTYKRYAQKHGGSGVQPEDFIEIEVVEGSITLESSEDFISIDKKERIQLTATLSEDPPGDVTFSFYQNKHLIDEVTTSGKTATLHFPENLPPMPKKIRFHVTVDNPDFPEPIGGDGGPTGDPEANEVDVVFFKARFTIYVNQPGDGGDDNTFEVLGPAGLIDVGHAWFQLSISPSHGVPPQYNSVINIMAGYRPVTGYVADPFIKPSVPGELTIPETQGLFEVGKD